MSSAPTLRTSLFALAIAACTRSDDPAARKRALEAAVYGEAAPTLAQEITDPELSAACFVRHALVECKVQDYDSNAAVSAALIRFFVRSADANDARWRGWRERLRPIVAARPKTQGTLDVLIAEWRRAPDDALVPLILAYDYPLVEARFTETSELGKEEMRLLLCQLGNCHATDLEALVKLLRARVFQRAADDDRDVELAAVLALGPDEAWAKVTRLSKWLTVERRAFVSIGKEALESLWALYQTPSRALWTLAATAISEIDPAGFTEQMKKELKSKRANAPERAILALYPLDDPALDTIYGLAAVHPSQPVAAYAQKALAWRAARKNK